MFALGGCGEPPDSIVAKVGDHEIRASSLRKLFGDLSPEATDKTGDEARRHYLQILVDGRLLLLEARSRGIDTTQAVDESVRKAVNVRVRALYQRSQIGPGQPVTEADVRQIFEREGFDVERRLSRILAPDRQTIDEIAEALEAGQTFAEVAAVHSIDATSQRESGELGYVGPPLLTRLQIPPDLYQSLADGEVSRPIPFAGGAWQVVRFTDTEPVAFSKYATLIETGMKKERTLQALKEHREALAHSYNARLSDAGLSELMEAYSQRQPDAVAASSTPLYHHDGGVITVARAHQSLGLRRSFADSAEAERLVRQAVLYPRLLDLAAAAAGLYETPEIRKFRKQRRDQELAESIRSIALAGIQITEDEVRQYYESNQGIFLVEGHAVVEELLLTSEAAAAGILERIEAGEEFAELAAHSLRPDARKHRARYHFHRHERLEYPELMEAIEAATVRELTGPVAVAGGHSVFRVLERVPESLQPFARARPRARVLLLERRQVEVVEQMILELRQKYEPDVVVFPDELTRSLPDSSLRKSRGV